MRHFYSDIPGWASFAKLYVDIVRAAPAQGAHFVEIGSWQGRSAALMAVEIINSGKQITFDCVDPWSDGGPDLKHKIDKANVGPDWLYEQFLKNTKPVAHMINARRMKSLEAAPTYQDASLDFVMIDGSHQYDDVRADIVAWLPKIKPGGYISGDDYNWSGVQQAVNELLPGRFRVFTNTTRKQGKKGHPRYWVVKC